MPELTNIFTALDERRIRAFSVQILEEAANEGNTLLTDTQLVILLDQLPIQPVCNPSIRNLNCNQQIFRKMKFFDTSWTKKMNFIILN